MTGENLLAKSISVSEVFGPTIQGEGEGAGRPAMFVRLGLCNLDCAWCDTPFTWDWTGKNGTAYDKATEVTRMPVAELVGMVASRATTAAKGTNPTQPMVVITGGEPLIQTAAVDALVVALIDQGTPRIEIETNGTQMPSPLLRAVRQVHFNVSPKLAGSGVAPEKAIVPEVLRALDQALATFKFVISNDTDIAQVAELVDAGLIPADRTILMPEGRTPEELAARFRWLFDVAAEHGWRLSHRLHVLAHDDERGF